METYHNQTELNRLQTKLENVKAKRFYLQMKDHWGVTDYAQDRMYVSEIKQIEHQMDFLCGVKNGKDT